MSLLDKFEEYVKIAPWLQAVGLAIAILAFAALKPVGFFGHVEKAVGLVGCFVSLFGFIYKKVYP